MGLANKRILLGVSGGIAAYKSAELVRLLRGAGAEVRVVMTKAAGEFIRITSYNVCYTKLLRTRPWLNRLATNQPTTRVSRAAAMFTAYSMNSPWLLVSQ